MQDDVYEVFPSTLEPLAAKIRVWPFIEKCMLSSLGAPQSIDIADKHNVALPCSKTFPEMYSFPMFIPPFEVLGGYPLFSATPVRLCITMHFYLDVL